MNPASTGLCPEEEWEYWECQNCGSIFYDSELAKADMKRHMIEKATAKNEQQTAPPERLAKDLTDMLGELRDG